MKTVELSVENNIELTNLSEREQANFLYEISDLCIEYRNLLPLVDKIHFGFEVECDGINKFDKENILDDFDNKNFKGWRLVRDGSLYDFRGSNTKEKYIGLELVSPILSNTSKNWSKVNSALNIMSRYAIASGRTGGHIHLESRYLGSSKRNWNNFFALISTYEPIFYRHCYGEFLNERSKITSYAAPCSKKMWEMHKELSFYTKPKFNVKDFVDFYKLNNKTSYMGTNLSHISTEKPNNRTIEFRFPNSSTNPIIWQNNLNLLANTLKAARDKDFDMDIVEETHSNIVKELNNLDTNSKLKYYRSIHLKEALELADIVFDNEEDKVYFLVQYIKDGRTIKETKPRQLVKSKKFYV